MADLTAEKNNRLLTLPEPLFYRPSSPCSHCEVNNKNASDVSPCPRLSITQGTACRPLWELMTRDFKCSGAISIIKFSVCFQPLVYVLQKAKKKTAIDIDKLTKSSDTGGEDSGIQVALTTASPQRVRCSVPGRAWRGVERWTEDDIDGGRHRRKGLHHCHHRTGT